MSSARPEKPTRISTGTTSRAASSRLSARLQSIRCATTCTVPSHRGRSAERRVLAAAKASCSGTAIAPCGGSHSETSTTPAIGSMTRPPASSGPQIRSGGWMRTTDGRTSVVTRSTVGIPLGWNRRLRRRTPGRNVELSDADGGSSPDSAKTMARTWPCLNVMALRTCGTTEKTTQGDSRNTSNCY